MSIPAQRVFPPVDACPPPVVSPAEVEEPPSNPTPRPPVGEETIPPGKPAAPTDSDSAEDAVAEAVLPDGPRVNDVVDCEALVRAGPESRTFVSDSLAPS